MTNNQTIDGVPREMLQRFAKYLDDGLHLSREEREILDELRALLDAPVECRCKRYGKSNPHWPCPVHTESAQGQALDELRALLAAARCDSCDDSGDLIDLTGEWRGYCVCPIGVALKNKPPPARPVAVVRITLQQVLKAYDYANRHPHKYLRGTTNWCAAVAHSLNAEQPAQVAVVLPARSDAVASANVSAKQAYALGWNACLDQVKRLNPPSGTEPSGTHPHNDGLDEWRKP